MRMFPRAGACVTRGAQAQYVALTRFRQAQPSQAFPRTTHVPQCCGCRARRRPARSTWPHAASRPLTPRHRARPSRCRLARHHVAPFRIHGAVARLARRARPSRIQTGQPFQSSRRSVPVIGSFRQQVHPFEAQCPQRLPCVVCVWHRIGRCAPRTSYPLAGVAGRGMGAPARIVGRLARGVFITWR